MEGSTSLADTCSLCGWRPPRFVFFAISGSMCNVVQLLLDRLLTSMLPEDVWWIPTASWTLSYTLSVALRHYSHAWFVFGQHSDSMWIALGRTYVAYASTIIASTAVNLLLVWGTACKPDVALILTASFSVIWSYFALSKTWRSTHAEVTGSSCTGGRGEYQQLPLSAPASSRVSEIVPAPCESPIPSSGRSSAPGSAQGSIGSAA